MRAAPTRGISQRQALAGMLAWRSCGALSDQPDAYMRVPPALANFGASPPVLRAALERQALGEIPAGRNSRRRAGALICTHAQQSKLHRLRRDRSRPSAVRGPVLGPPCMRQRPFAIATPRHGPAHHGTSRHHQVEGPYRPWRRASLWRKPGPCSSHPHSGQKEGLLVARSRARLMSDWKHGYYSAEAKAKRAEALATMRGAKGAYVLRSLNGPQEPQGRRWRFFDRWRASQSRKC